MGHVRKACAGVQCGCESDLWYSHIKASTFFHCFQTTSSNVTSPTHWTINAPSRFESSFSLCTRSLAWHSSHLLSEISGQLQLPLNAFSLRLCSLVVVSPVPHWTWPSLSFTHLGPFAGSACEAFLIALTGLFLPLLVF